MRRVSTGGRQRTSDLFLQPKYINNNNVHYNNKNVRVNVFVEVCVWEEGLEGSLSGVGLTISASQTRQNRIL